MLQLILLVFFLLQCLVVLGALIFVIFFARPEVPLKGDGTKDTRPEAKSTDTQEKSNSGDDAANLRRQDFATFHHQDFDRCPTHLAA